MGENSPKITDAGKSIRFLPYFWKVPYHIVRRTKWKKELPKLDDEFAKDVSEFDTLKELKADIKKNLEHDNEHRAKHETEDAVIKALSDATEIDIPSGMIETEIDNIAKDVEQRLQYQGLKLEDYLKMMGKTMEDFRKENEEPAKEAVKARLVLEAVIKAEKIEPTDSEITEKIKEMAKNYNRKEDELIDNAQLKDYLRENLKTEKAIDFLVKNAKIK